MGDTSAEASALLTLQVGQVVEDRQRAALGEAVGECGAEARLYGGRKLGALRPGSEDEVVDLSEHGDIRGLIDAGDDGLSRVRSAPPHRSVMAVRSVSAWGWSRKKYPRLSWMVLTEP